MPLPEEDERYVQVIEKRIADAGLEGVGVVRGNRFPMGQGDEAIADGIQQRIDDNGGQSGDYPVTVVGAKGTTAQRDSLADREGKAVEAYVPSAADRQLEVGESGGVVMADATHFTEDQLAAVKPMRAQYKKNPLLVADTTIAPDHSVGEGHPPGVVMAQPDALQPAPKAELVHSDRPATPGELKDHVEGQVSKAKASRKDAEA